MYHHEVERTTIAHPLETKEARRINEIRSKAIGDALGYDCPRRPRDLESRYLAVRDPESYFELAMI